MAKSHPVLCWPTHHPWYSDSLTSPRYPVHSPCKKRKRPSKERQQGICKWTTFRPSPIIHFQPPFSAIPSALAHPPFSSASHSNSAAPAARPRTAAVAASMPWSQSCSRPGSNLPISGGAAAPVCRLPPRVTEAPIVWPPGTSQTTAVERMVTMAPSGRVDVKVDVTRRELACAGGSACPGGAAEAPREVTNVESAPAVGK